MQTRTTKPKAQAKPAKAGKRRIGPYTLPTSRELTHEQLVHAVYGLALQRPELREDERRQLRAIKLTYGAGPDGVRGITYYHRWQQPCACGKRHGPKDKRTKGCSKPDDSLVPLVSVCATGQESLVQCIGTTLHELGHVLAPMKGHGAEWHAACERLGLIKMQAAGTAYSWDNFVDGDWRKALQALPEPVDGQPADIMAMLAKLGMPQRPDKLKLCTEGWGTRGGTSRGAGSGSRLLLWECACEKPVKIRHAGRELRARCEMCGELFKLQEASQPAPQQGQEPPQPPVQGKGKGQARKAVRKPAKARQQPLPKGEALRISKAVNAPLKPVTGPKPRGKVQPVSGPGKPEDPLPF